jgi:hypothetical protein
MDLRCQKIALMLDMFYSKHNYLSSSHLQKVKLRARKKLEHPTQADKAEEQFNPGSQNLNENLTKLA